MSTARWPPEGERQHRAQLPRVMNGSGALVPGSHASIAWRDQLHTPCVQGRAARHPPENKGSCFAARVCCNDHAASQRDFDAVGRHGGASWATASWPSICRWGVCACRDWHPLRPRAACRSGSRKEACLPAGSLLAARRSRQATAEVREEVQAKTHAADARGVDGTARARGADQPRREAVRTRG